MTASNYRHSGLSLLVQAAAQTPLNPSVDSFYFLRHGETDGNRLKFFQGPEQPLNALGIEQARAAAAILRDQQVSRIVASDMARTLQTAALVSEALSMSASPEANLRERNFGDLVGSSSLIIDWAATPPGGESLDGFVTRVRGGLRQALAHAGTLIVAHGGTLYVLAAALGATLDEKRHTANANPLRFIREGTSWKIEAFDVRQYQDAPNFS